MRCGVAYLENLGIRTITDLSAVSVTSTIQINILQISISGKFIRLRQKRGKVTGLLTGGPSPTSKNPGILACSLTLSRTNRNICFLLMFLSAGLLPPAIRSFEKEVAPGSFTAMKANPKLNNKISKAPPITALLCIISYKYASKNPISRPATTSYTLY